MEDLSYQPLTEEDILILDSIKEERSISSDVEEEANKIIEILTSNLENSFDYANPTKYGDNVREIKGNFAFIVFENRIRIEYSVIYFKNEMYFYKYRNKFRFGASIENEKGLLKIVTFSLYGNLDEKFTFDSIYHELEHFYQFIKSNHNLSKNGRTYDEIVKILLRKADFSIYNLTVTDKENMFNFASIFYGTFNFEQDALVHGLYGLLIKTKGIDLPYILRQSDAYLYLAKMNEFYKKIDVLKNYDIFKLFLSIINISFDKAKKILYYAIKRFSNKIGKAYSLAYDKLNEGKNILYDIRKPIPLKKDKKRNI